MPDLIIHDSTPNDILYPRGFAHGYSREAKAASPVPMMAPPADMLLIDPSEWDARIKEQDEQQSSLEHIRMRSGPNGGHIPALDQNGQGYCTTSDTEVLTEGGWVPWPEYNGTDLIGTMNPDNGA